MADPGTAGQLTRGFYDPEQGSWRWTAKEFSVVLRAPANAREKGALLVFKFVIPTASIERLKVLQLSATLDGGALDPETYSKAGECIYERAVESSAFAKKDVVTLDFLLDKALPPSGADQRELGVVAQSVGLEAR